MRVGYVLRFRKESRMFTLLRHSNGVEITRDCQSQHSSLFLAGKALTEAKRESQQLGLSDVWIVEDASGVEE